MNLVYAVLLYGFAIVIGSDKYTEFQKGNKVIKNNMEVQWKYVENSIEFTMSAPTDGWVTIGFNNQESKAGCYLLMGRIQNGNVEVVEHYTQSPGNYKPISKYNVVPKVAGVRGEETGKSSTIEFSLPQKANCQYQKDLFPGKQYVMVLAYSQSDDFQHHSIMRTSVKVKL